VRGAMLVDTIGDEVGGVENMSIDELLKIPQWSHLRLGGGAG